MSSRLLLPLLLVAGLAACGREAPVAPAARVEGLQTFQVPAAEAAGGRAWEGVVEAVQQATLSAQTNGRVAAVERDVNDRVAAGDVLVRLSAVEQQAGMDAARAQLRAAEASATEADANYRRFANLAKDQFVSKAQLDQARMARDSATAARDAARAQLANAGQQTGYTTVRAPYAGIVATRDVEPGESVGLGQTLMTVFAPGALRIDVAVPQSEAEAIRAHPVAVVVLDDGRRIDAAAVTVFPAADASTHAMRIRLQLPALDAPPQPGLTAKVAFPAVKGAAFPRVPVSALVRRGEVTAVYVLGDGRLSLRQVRLGDAAGDQVDVISGLKPGDRVAADPVAAQQALVAARKDD
ncbi:efflux transporter periplasmic adaptor subunit [Pseudoxanthomonas japonensis]|uniref:Efflux transporter periplasmic adaptor subunit n=2 Tax=Pseudoxanthomonas japonensis TaxID=69284 RepID=A0ABQ6ZE42_9GAMM|nr:efflux transporter periplasmic adaptor subunit [Pseudoxanthomonas japonensis]